ncbi:tRNA lysidine(34) synthetase TilS [Aegicerativicinus sediminis]|uniref:tRNA lysidine(34) synthetase TilS n=1 Tax=Aegicerativicinus sediminis TaxID=2893202 RepID=UPI001E52DC45|nr:tRNA lysidine(34) synthetase TilS [Aegicerativicinus sediminis]
MVYLGMLETFHSHIKNRFPFILESRCLVTVSGGVDSITLTHLCTKIGLDVSLAHCNFCLRGKESDVDEDFVNRFGDQLGLEVFSQRFDTKGYASENKLSTQVAARNLRYNWFQELANQLQFDYILTAHHADDSLETFLINFSRGTGLEGLTGIPEINENIVRPLLAFSREDIEVYAIENHLKWRDDSSNAETKYLRNKLRHDVIPTLKSINSNLLKNFLTTQRQLLEIREIVEDRMNDVSESVIEEIDDSKIVYNIPKLEELNNPKAYLYQLLKEYGFTSWNDIENLLTSQPGKQVFSSDYRLLKDRETLILMRQGANETEDTISVESLDPVAFGEGKLMFAEVENWEELDEPIIFIDVDKIQLPLTLRKWQDGDFFYPIGMRGKKKVSKFLKDEKWPLIKKEGLWILCSGDDVVWLVGDRMDDRFKITDQTKRILKIQLIQNK